MWDTLYLIVTGGGGQIRNQKAEFKEFKPRRWTVLNRLEPTQISKDWLHFLTGGTNLVLFS